MATIADKSRTKEIIDRLQSILDTAPSVPLAAGKVSVYKDEMQSLLSELASQMEIELKTYHEVNDRRGRIISEAKKEAEKIIYNAERTASRMRVTKHTTGVAPLDYSVLTEEERSALGNANEIYAASLIYTDEMLTEVTDMISTAYHNIRSDYEIVLNAFEEKLNIINNNRAELMEGLQEMDVDDRSQQILEIGQLLSNELYESRMKARMESDEYEDGSVQLSLDLQNMQEEQKAKTREAEEKAQRAEEALVQMIAERDALAQKVEILKQDNRRMKMEPVKPKASIQKKAVQLEEVPQKETAKPNVSEQKATVQFQQPTKKEEEEYEIVYVTEDELEEGEEYEIEYVDEEEYEAYIETRGASNPTTKEVVQENVQKKSDQIKKDAKESKIETVAEKVVETTENSESSDKETEKLPVIPHFKKSESGINNSKETIASKKNISETEKKQSGLIGRAVKQRELQALNETVKMVEETVEAEVAVTKEDVTATSKDEDVRIDANGKEYVQATMVFDENFEITEF